MHTDGLDLFQELFCSILNEIKKNGGELPKENVKEVSKETKMLVKSYLDERRKADLDIDCADDEAKRQLILGLQEFIIKYKTEIYEEWQGMKENNSTNKSLLNANNEVNKMVKDGQFYEDTCQVVRESVQILLEMVNSQKM